MFTLESVNKRLAIAILVAALLVGVLVFVAEGRGGTMHIKGTEGADEITIDEGSSTITCPTCKVIGDATPESEGVWTIDAGGDGNNHYKIETGNGDDMVSINDAEGNDEYDINAGPKNDMVSLNDGAGNDKYNAKGGPGDDAIDFSDYAGDDDIVYMET